MAPMQRNASTKLSNAWDARCVTSCTSGTRRRSDASQNNVTDVTVTTAGKAIRIIVTTTSGRIAMTAVVKKKQEDKIPSDPGNKAFKPCSTHGPKSKHTSKECCKNPKNQNKHQTHTKNFGMRHTTMMRVTQVMTMSCALVPIHRSQVRTRRQRPARAKPTRMRTIIPILIINWRQVAMCLASLTINSIEASPNQVKKSKKEKHLLLSWTMILILQTPS